MMTGWNATEPFENIELKTRSVNLKKYIKQTALTVINLILWCLYQFLLWYIAFCTQMLYYYVRVCLEDGCVNLIIFDAKMFLW